jgi:hypothetical protein
MLTAVPRQIPLTVTVDVEAARHAPALNGRLPDGGVDRLSSPRDIARQAHIDRKQMSHRLPSQAERGPGFPRIPVVTKPGFA